MLDVVGNKGPLAVAIDATGPHFHHYKKGIYNNPNCSNTKLNHAVLIVGYVSIYYLLYIFKAPH